MKKSGRFFVADGRTNIPLHAHPENGYTFLQAIARAQREIEECVKIFGGKFQDYKDGFSILDSNFYEVAEAKDAI